MPIPTTKAAATRAANTVAAALAKLAASGVISWDDADEMGERAVACIFATGVTPLVAVGLVLKGDA